MNVKSSDRLSYRLLNENDGELLFQLDQNPEVMRFINGGKMTSRADIDNVFLPRLAGYTNSEKGWGMWGVFIEPQQEFIGWILIRPMEFFSDKPHYDDIEIGWRFMQKAWGKGFATEAAKQVMTAILPVNTQAKVLTALAMADNLGSINIMKKLGMHFDREGKHVGPNGECDVVYYQLSV